MTLAQVRALTKTLATWLAATTSLLFAVSRFLPSGRPGGYNGADDAWIQMLHMAFAERLQFGRDIVFTFGPWGFLFGGYHPPTYLISVVVWVATCAFAQTMQHATGSQSNAVDPDYRNCGEVR